MIDTASPRIAMALGDGLAPPRTAVIDDGFDHTRLLVPAIRELLGSDGPPGAVAVVCGPGSYAGIRVGMATAEGLAMALGVPVIGVGTIEAIIAACALEEGMAIHPVGRGTFAVRRFANAMPFGLLESARAEDVSGLGSLAGEGAGALGGREVTALDRCLAALALARVSLKSGSYGPLTAIYLREPAITRPRESLPQLPPAPS